MRTIEQLHSEIDFLLELGTGIKCFDEGLNACERDSLSGVPNSFTCQLLRLQIAFSEMQIAILNELVPVLERVCEALTKVLA